MANDKTTPAETPNSNMVTMDANTLAATIAAAVAQAMAAVQPQQATNHEALGAAIADGISKSSRRKVTNGEYALRGPRNYYHPKSKAETPVLKRELFQTGIPVPPDTLLDREIELLNRVTHSGRYCNRLVEVVFSPDAIDVRYNNKTPDQRFELKNYFRSFEELMEIVVRQQEEEDRQAKELDEDKQAERRKREEAKEKFSFGNSKAAKEAREKAGVE
jgi:hypothetical protein